MFLAYKGRNIVIALISVAVFFFVAPSLSSALNVHQYKDTITNSRPSGYANHTLAFVLNTDVAAGGSIEVTPPVDFEIRSTSTFDVRNVELLVDGVARTSGATLSANIDQVIITTGSPGSIRYNLNPTTGIAKDSSVEMRIGNHTTNATSFSVNFSTSTGTTTTPGDVYPIKNSTSLGTHQMNVVIEGGTEPAYADFSIAIVAPIKVPNSDTTEEIPPYRFNGAPSGEIGGTTFNVEISLETDEFADCRYTQTASTSFASMNKTFESTGFVIHRQLVAVVPESENTYYVRCIDDEGNFNIDDYVITFVSPEPPEGTPGEEGGTDGTGDGTGSGGGGSGTGTGDASDGEGGTGNVDGGSSSGSGGSGGGSGGRSGSESPDESGGGLEDDYGPYESGDAQVIINGYASPGSTVYALVDGYVSETERADNDGKYSVTIEEIARGVYTFGVYAIDRDDVKSSTFSTSFTVTGGRTSNLSNINVMPSIAVEPDPVDVGGQLTISGYALPDALITLQNQKEGSSVSLKTLTTESDGSGEWSLAVDTSAFSSGTYKVRAKAEQNDTLVATDYSEYTYYGVGQTANTPLNADLNTDGNVNLTDFSILLFWWGSDGGNSNPPADINQDGSVSLTDFSILLFNWTG